MIHSMQSQRVRELIDFVAGLNEFELDDIEREVELDRIAHKRLMQEVQPSSANFNDKSMY